MSELVLSKKSSDLSKALLLVLKNDMGRVLRHLALEDVPDAAKNSISGLLHIGGYAKSMFNTAKESGVKRAGAKVAADSREFAGKVYRAPSLLVAGSRFGVAVLRERISQLSDDEKGEFILKLACYTISFAGGAYLGNATPDKDFKVLGPGRHRDFLFHSVFATLAITTLARFLWRVFDEAGKYLPEESGDTNTLEFLKINTKFLAFGGCVGVATHLGIDGTFQGTKSVTNPFSGTFIYGTIADDNAYLVFNSILAAFAGGAEIKERAS